MKLSVPLYVVVIFFLAAGCRKMDMITYKTTSTAAWQQEEISNTCVMPVRVLHLGEETSLWASCAGFRCRDYMNTSTVVYSRRLSSDEGPDPESGDWINYVYPLTDTNTKMNRFVFEKVEGDTTVLGYACKRAMCHGGILDSVNTEVFYTDQIAIRHPWFPSLPGFPVEIIYQQAGGEIHMQAEAVQKVRAADVFRPNGVGRTAETITDFKDFGQGGTFDSTEVIVSGVVNDYFKKHPLALVPIEVRMDGDSGYHTSTRLDGKYDLLLNTGHSYVIRFGETPYVSKHLLVDLVSTPTSPGGYWFPIDGSLFLPREGLDFSFLETQPMAKAAYDPDTDGPEFDYEYTKQMSERVDSLFKLKRQ